MNQTDRMLEYDKVFVNGSWQTGDGPMVEVIDPSDESVIGAARLGSLADLREATAGARRRFVARPEDPHLRALTDEIAAETEERNVERISADFVADVVLGIVERDDDPPLRTAIPDSVAEAIADRLATDDAEHERAIRARHRILRP